MFRQHPKDINALVQQYLRANGLETPLLQRRLLALWDKVAGNVVAQNTEHKEIRNQTLWVKILNPAVRADLQMRRSELVTKLNNSVGAQILSDIKVY